MNAIVVGRHGGDIPGATVVKQRAITWPATARECSPIITELVADALAGDAALLFQNTPGQVAVALAWRAAAKACQNERQRMFGDDTGTDDDDDDDALTTSCFYDGGWRAGWIGIIVSVPGPRPGKVRQVFDFGNAAGAAAAAVKFSNPRASVTVTDYDDADYLGNVGYDIGVNPYAVEVDGPPMPFEFSHIEWL